MKMIIVSSALLATLIAVPVAIERNRITPDVWTGAPTTVRAEISQEERDREMRAKMKAPLLNAVEMYAPINAIAINCGFEAADQRANSAMLESAKTDSEISARVATLHWQTQKAYMASGNTREMRQVFCDKIKRTHGHMMRP
jgi:hypothetical protein